MIEFCVPVIGDAHFKTDARQPDRLASVDQILDECGSIKASLSGGPPIGMWAVPGDLFDSNSDVLARNAWADRIQFMANVAPVLICYGNHDRDHDLYYLGKVKGQFQVYVIDRPQTVVVRLPKDLGDIVVFVLPYPYPAGLVAEGTAPADVIPKARAMLDVIFMQASANLVKAQKDGRPTLFIGHANVGGSRMSTGQPLIGQEIELDPALLVRLGDCPKILNHIHMPQEIGGAWLTGSITAQTWGECEPKRYLVVEYSHDL